MSGSFIPALERKPWERHVQTNAKSTFLAQNALPSPTLAPAVPMTTVRFANGSVWRQYQPQRGQSPGGYRLRPHYLAALTKIMSLFSFLDRKHTIAGPGFSRWMVPPAALCVHLCIGQAYAFSVFNLPMTKLIGITQSAPDDWKLTELGWIFSIAIFFLGASAAVFGRWVEEGGPRRAMFTAALCWAGGFLISAFGVYMHNLWVIYLGYGVIGGIA